MGQWRETMRPARFFIVDARAAVLIGVCMLHFRTWTVMLTLIGMVVLVLLERKGLTVPAAFRAIRAFIAGNRRPHVSWMKRRRLVDTYHADMAAEIKAAQREVKGKGKKKG
ncbi:MAG: hypothetical protein Alpg2KO_02040 [Alphaproteobacteria bacterium]